MDVAVVEHCAGLSSEEGPSPFTNPLYEGMIVGTSAPSVIVPLEAVIVSEAGAMLKPSWTVEAGP
jgi:hypothetical protein